MEPARQGRDDQQDGLLLGQVADAAMEPAHQGRDDLEAHPSTEPVHLPQWSPPVRGGTTAREKRAF
jgi:hypothetical protein